MTTQAANYVNRLPKIQKVAQSRGGQCLSDMYVNNTSPLRFECNIGHQWETTWKNVNKGAWCPECAIIAFRGSNNSRFDSIDNMRKIAEERGGKCVSQEYLGAHAKLQWQCMLGHEWTAKPNAIKNGTWCPKCSEGIGERVCRLIFETLFQAQFLKVRPEWLRNSISGKNLELDGYCEQLGIAFEYNGAQHYTEDTMYPRSQYDVYKAQLCYTRGVRLFTIKEIPHVSKYRDIVEQAILQAKNYGIILNSEIEIPINEVYKTNVSVLFLQELCDISTERGGKCLSDTYIDCAFKLDFQCGTCEFIWSAAPNAIKSGTWCPNCANKIKSINDAQQLAANKNGKCLSVAYTNSTDKMSWECEAGHQWAASYNQIQSGGWCPVCFELHRGQAKKLGIEVYKAAAQRKGGMCLSEDISSCYDKLEWQCSEGHVWSARADMVKNTKQWCPVCAMKRRIAGLQQAR